MADNALEKAKSWTEKHPFIVAVGAGLVVVAIVLYLRNKGASTSSSGTNPAAANCTDQYGNPIDCQSGNPLGNVSNSPATTGDLTTQIQDLEQVLSGFTNMLQNNNSNGSQMNIQCPVGYVASGNVCIPVQMIPPVKPPSTDADNDKNTTDNDTGEKKTTKKKTTKKHKEKAGTK